MKISIGNTTLSSINKSLGGGSVFTNTKSLQFDGVDEYVDLGTSSTLEFTNDFSVSVWIKDTASLNRGILCCSNRSALNGWQLQRTSANKVSFYCGARTATSTSLINTGDWINVIATWEKNVGGGIGNRVRIYVNGILEDTDTRLSTASPDYTGTLYKQIAFPYAGTNEFLGNIDEVAAFNYLLSTDEINTVSTAPSDLTSLSPVAWYRMGDNSTYQTPQILMPENTNKNKVSNYSLAFDGLDDYIQVADYTDSINDFSQPWSISWWAKWDYTPSFDCFFQFGKTTTTVRYILAWAHSTGIGYSVSNSGSIGIDYNIGTNLNDGNWHHIVFTGDGTTSGGGKINVYIDGVLNTDTPTATGISANQNTMNNIGRGASTTGRNFNGNIDELSIYSSELNATQVSDIYNSGEPTTISGATAYWKLGELSKFTDNWLVPNSALSNYSNYSFNFDGVDDYVNTNLNLSTQSFTISWWFKLGSSQALTSHFPLCVNNSLNPNRSPGRMYGNQLILQCNGYTERFGSPTYNFDNYFPYPAINFFNDPGEPKWHNAVWTFDVTTDVLNLFIDGVKQKFISFNNWPTVSPYEYDLKNAGGTLGSLTIGASFGGALANYNGNVDEVAVFDSVLNATQITSIYNSGEPTTISGSVAHWRMGEDATYNSSTSEWTIPDQIGSNDGTSSNTMALNTLVGEAPNYTGGGLSDAMTIEDRTGDAPNSENNAVSYNMEAIDIDNNTP